MNILNSRLYSILEVLSFFFLLNIIWVLMCLPIITIFPATAAMFGVIRQWVMKKDTAIFIPFFRFFKENFKQSFIVGIIFFIFASIFYIDFMLVNTFNPKLHTLLFASLFLLGLIVTFTLVYVFPMMVHYRLTLWQVIKNSFFFSIRYALSTILCVILLVAMVSLLFLIPVTFLVIFSITAYLIFTICYSRFRKEEVLVTGQNEENIE
ncbi:YesL family protein [Lederbergia wuyishanensis]|uniref:Membrane protein YesL n=1 Tax=Lederbergia wuyishanensis TaxID=1347903 RepID=A0ABU0D7V2_9BACI|nr:DUF624 domain-containing protein [Lederbergia wuyishanensis]MCJ8009164.1 DUF624 domain-containing protein [Lederbergia wuyishanensis]MDQ0344504.1 putative membrane protein YesL [Lederbergia wuyishanensis]